MCVHNLYRQVFLLTGRQTAALSRVRGTKKRKNPSYVAKKNLRQVHWLCCVDMPATLTIQRKVRFTDFEGLLEN